MEWRRASQISGEIAKMPLPRVTKRGGSATSTEMGQTGPGIVPTANFVPQWTKSLPR